MAPRRLLSVRSPRAWMLFLLLIAALAGWWRTLPADRDELPLAVAPPPSTPATAPGQPAAEEAAHSPPVAAAATTPPATRAVVPHRASTGQRAEDLRRMSADPDLFGLASELEARANAGDADAAWALAGIYEVCAGVAMFIGKPDEFAAEFRKLALMGFTEAEVPRVERAFGQVMQRCSGFPGAMLTAMGALNWRNRALALGHPAARMQQPRPNVDLESPQMQEFDRQQKLVAIELLQQGDPLDLARFATDLAMRSRYDYDSYTLAACRLVPTCAADPDRFAFTLMETQPFDAQGTAFTLLRDMSPRRRMITEGQSAEIVRLWRARRFDELLRGRPQPNGLGGR